MIHHLCTVGLWRHPSGLPWETMKFETSLFLFSLQWWVWMAALSPTRLHLKSEEKEGGRETLGLRTRRKDLRTEPRTKWRKQTLVDYWCGHRKSTGLNTDLPSFGPESLHRCRLSWTLSAACPNNTSMQYKTQEPVDMIIVSSRQFIPFLFSFLDQLPWNVCAWRVNKQNTLLFFSVLEKVVFFLFLSHISLRRPTLRWSSVPLRRIHSIRHPSSSAVLKAAGLPWVTPILFCSLFLQYYLTTNLFLAILSPNIFV